MRIFPLVPLVALFLGVAFSPDPALASSLGKHEVYGVAEDDMLKLRAGPGTGYSVIVGLPNGTVLRVHSCERTGATRWCKVSLDRARGLKGYVSWAYLRKI
ncbi:Bacterial SH3 domain protein [Roseovarius albus]|uniref:Bacterial SH3 domain protein n=1 Tax=Roseovarius albus TaxID=1247867 RepID=A0A1X6YY85_9RHOB|nr:SH3 domain-containing protein [Roseovarius albus]SLN34845.1 Bacterial SH3 domain protein [Roseovarius albus]